MKTVLSISCVALAACAGPGEPRRPAPDYANAIGQDFDYEVDCGASLVVVDRNATHHFYNEDGTPRTREQFCEEYRGDTRIR